MSKQNLAIALLLLLAGGALGFSFAHLGGDSAPTEKMPLYWVNPMDPNDKRPHPAKDSMGMDFLPVYEESNSSSPGTVTIAPQIQQNIGVRTELVTRQSLTPELTSVGFVSVAEDRIEAVTARMEGWLRTLKVKNEGQRVAQGELLYELYAPDLVNAQHEFLLALKSQNRPLQQAAIGKLRALSFPESQIQLLQKTQQVTQTLKFYAPINGYISALSAREGQYVEPATPLFAIAPLKQVWITSELFERDAALVQRGDRVAVGLDYHPERSWQGVVDYLYPTLDPQTRTLKLRVRVENVDETLKPNMFAQLQILGQPLAAKLVVPAAAVIRTGKQERVVLALGSGNFKSVAVTLGARIGAQQQILSGLEEGDRVVTSAQFLLDSESSIDSDFQRMTAVRPTQVWVKGEVTAIDAKTGRVMISHEEVPEWQWPPMEMEFGLKGVTLEQFKLGAKLRIAMEQQGSDYLITEISGEE